MGLFDFLKKPRTDAPGAANKSGNSEPGERTSVFKGDLAFIGENSTEKKPEPVHTDPVSAGQTTEPVRTPPVSTGDPTENKDSEDSVVFLSFAPVKKGCWICPECGTNNDEGSMDCVVCGFK